MGHFSPEAAVSKFSCSSVLSTSLRKQYVCEVCSQTFPKLCYLRLHMKYHAYKCTLCPCSFMRQSHLRSHVTRKHKLPKVKSKETHFVCERCARNFESKYDYKMHIWHYHRDKYICGKLFCRKKFKTREEYDYHRRNHALNPCSVCGKRVKRLSEHFLLHCNKRYTCQMCNKDYCNYNTLRRHVLIHLKIKSYTCSVCGKAFRQKYNLVLHCRTHSGEKPYSCLHCSKKFARAGALKLHDKSVHGGKEAKTFKCDQCNFAAVCLGHLNEHKITHREVIKCGKCSVVLANKQTLRRHLLTECEKKCFPCVICAKEYSRKAELTKHKKQFHSYA